MRTAIRTAASVSSSVGSARSRMASVTGLRRKIELPRSPWSRRPYQRTSWTWSGWSRPSCWAILLTSSAEASGPAMREAGSPGARWISTKPTVATTSATGISARSRRRTYVFTPAPGLPVEPGDEALDLPSHGLQRGIVAELDTARVLVEEVLHALPERPALPGIHLPVERVHQPVLLLVAPPARPVAIGGDAERGIGGDAHHAGDEDVPELGLVAPLDQRGPVIHLEIDLESALLELLLGNAGHAAPAAQRGHHVGRGHLLAVVEADPAAQPERVRATAIAHRVAFDQQRDRGVVPVVGIERLVDVPGDLLGDDGRRPVKVEGRGLADHRGLQHPARPRLLGGGRRARQQRDAQREDTGAPAPSGHGIYLRRCRRRSCGAPLDRVDRSWVACVTLRPRIIAPGTRSAGAGASAPRRARAG